MFDLSTFWLSVLCYRCTIVISVLFEYRYCNVHCIGCMYCFYILKCLTLDTSYLNITRLHFLYRLVLTFLYFLPSLCLVKWYILSSLHISHVYFLWDHCTVAHSLLVECYTVYLYFLYLFTFSIVDLSFIYYLIMTHLLLLHCNFGIWHLPIVQLFSPSKCLPKNYSINFSLSFFFLDVPAYFSKTLPSHVEHMIQQCSFVVKECEY